MFESSVVGGEARTALRWLGAGSLVAPAVVLGGLAVSPLIYPARMPPFKAHLRPISLVKPELPQPKPQRVEVAKASAARQPALSTVEVHSIDIAAISHLSRPSASENPAMLPIGSSMGRDPGLISTLASSVGSGNKPVFAAAPAADNNDKRNAVRLSQGVSNGMLLEPIRPAYPPIAKATRTEGVVVLTAVIDRTGRIVGLRVLSGPPMLRQAAEAAVRDARYRPYLLNGSPTEVETTISVNFRMSS